MMSTDVSPEILGNVTHVIFDFDGLLMDTESCYTEATNRVAAPYGKIFTPVHKSMVIGFHPVECCRRSLEILRLPLSLEDFIEKLNQEIKRLLPSVELLPGVERLVSHLSQNKVPMGIATSSRKEDLMQKTSRFGNLFTEGTFFSPIITGDDPNVHRPKPAPDIFIECAKRFAGPRPERPQNVLVFEDSPTGIKGASAAGFLPVLVTENISIQSEEAVLRIPSLLEFDPQLFNLPDFVES